jgi:phosphoribosyl 1,2-cyclic phosphodiesterase
MNIKILGIGKKYKPSCLVSHILVDVGADILDKLTPTELDTITHVVLTHTHKDAIDGIPFLNKYLSQAGKFIDVYASYQVINTIKLRYSSTDRDWFKFHETHVNKVYDLKGINVVPLKVVHDKHYPTVAYSFNKQFVYGSDMGPIFESDLFKNNILAVLDGEYWDSQKRDNHIAVQTNIETITKLQNKHTYFISSGRYYSQQELQQQNNIHFVQEGDRMQIKDNDLIKSYRLCTRVDKLDWTCSSYVVEPCINGQRSIVEDKNNQAVYERVMTKAGQEVVTDILQYQQRNCTNDTVMQRLALQTTWLANVPIKLLPLRWIVTKDQLIACLTKLSKKYTTIVIRPTNSAYYAGKFIVHFEKEDDLGQVPDNTNSPHLPKPIASKSQDTDILKPVDVTDKYIRIRIRSPKRFVRGSFRTVTLSAKQGIKSIMGKFKSDPNGPMHVQSVLFDKKKWTVARARAWVRSHRDRLKNFIDKVERALNKRKKGNF